MIVMIVMMMMVVIMMVMIGCDDIGDGSCDDIGIVLTMKLTVVPVMVHF